MSTPAPLPRRHPIAREERLRGTATELPARIAPARPGPRPRRDPAPADTSGSDPRMRLSITGRRAHLAPLTPEARFAYDLAMAAAGVPYDRARARYVPSLRQTLRAGAATADSILLHAEHLGVEVAVDQRFERDARRLTRARARAEAPVPRAVWADAHDESGEHEEVAFRR